MLKALPFISRADPMAHPFARRSLAPLAVLVALSGCGDDDGTGPDEEQVPTSVQIANAALSFDLAGQTEQLDVTVLDQDGNTIASPTLTFALSDSSVAAVGGTGVVTALGNGITDVEVRAGTATASVSAEVTLTPTELEDGVPVSGLTAPEGGQLLFFLDVPAGNEGEQVLHVRMLGGTGDADLGLRFGTAPDLQSVDCASTGEPNDLDNLELCVVVAPEPGTWHFMAYGFEAFSGVTLEAHLKEWEPLTAGVPVTGLSDDLYDVRYFRIDLDEGESLDLDITGGTGDADLFATPSDVFAITQFGGMPCAPLLDGNEETCALSNVDEGPWTIMLLAFQAYTGVTLNADRISAANASSRRAERTRPFRPIALGRGR
jgi:hypothetical protein